MRQTKALASVILLCFCSFFLKGESKTLQKQLTMDIASVTIFSGYSPVLQFPHQLVCCGTPPVNSLLGYCTWLAVCLFVCFFHSIPYWEHSHRPDYTENVYQHLVEFEGRTD